MFDLLKKKISAFTDKIKAVVERKKKVSEKKEPEKIREGLEETLKVAKPEKAKEILVEKEPEKIIEETEKHAQEIEKKKLEILEEVEEQKVEKPEILEEREEIEKIPAQAERPVYEERKPKAKISLKTRLKALLSKEIEISASDIEGFLFEFELALLESDVEQETADEIINYIKTDLIGKRLGKRDDISTYLKQQIRTILQKIMETKSLDLLEMINKKRPFVILFLGLNGAGKTTSIAKLTHLLQKQNKRVIWAASDTFRAAAIEQLEKHAEKLNVRVVKHKYGADPAAVAFDAIAAAIANNIDVVMIDSAGRQETNRNLMAELQKIVRVAKPDLKIFVGEALAGKALLQQAEEFDKVIGIDAFILAKLDTDTKGGTSISLLHKIKKPIIYAGIGQSYEDLIEFKSDYIIDRVVV